MASAGKIILLVILAVTAILRSEVNLSTFLDNVAEYNLHPVLNNGVVPKEKNRVLEDRIPSDEERERYQPERERNYTGANIRSVSYRGVSGFGHRLARMSCAYHIAKVTNSSRLFASWGWECGPNEHGDPDIFDHLFGAGPMIVDPLVSVRNGGANVSHGWQSSVWWLLTETGKLPGLILQYQNGDKPHIINDVEGYIKADMVHRPHDQVHQDIFLEKLISDVEFFHQLRVLFRFNHLARGFMEEHRFDDHTVIGLHIRAGNGETGDFEDKNRGIQNIDSWLEAAARTLHGLNATLNSMGGEAHNLDQRKPPLIFLATDTPSVINKLSNYTKPYGIPVVTFPQERMKDGAGVSFWHKWETSSLCHQNWVSQFMDATILSASDVMVAGRYSSFSQTVPWTTMLAGSILGAIGMGDDDASRTHASKKAFCEVSRNGDRLICYNDYRKWIFARHERRERRLPSSTDVWIKAIDWHTKELHLPFVH